jgi:WD40 repeat protein/tRNA A-37 threonylcarbamoyl transferase component Bud32
MTDPVQPAAAARYARLHALLDEALRFEEHERARLLERLRAEDPRLATELAELLATAESDVTSSAPSAAPWLGDDAIESARRVVAAAESAAIDLAWTPERIAGFRILRRIGQGGMGVVFEAEQERPRRRVALKMMHPMLGSAERERRFRIEAEVLGRLQHDGIAQIYECGSFDLGRGAQPYFAMELVDGIDLVAYCEREQLDVDRRLELVAAVAEAVQHAHERGVVHRDLKPHNVLVTSAGRPKVLDFGVARAKDTSMLVSTMVTRTGELIGTLAYMAPEQLAGDAKGIDARSDVYSLGVNLYQLLAGHLPHDVVGLPLTAAMRVLAHDDPPLLGALHPRLRGDVETIVAKAMEKEPARRYASAAALAADIKRLLAQEPIEARPASRAYRAWKYMRRHKARVAGVAGTLVASLIGTGVSLRYAFRADREAQIASANERRAQAGALDLAEHLAERGDEWSAVTILQSIVASARGWEYDFVARALPPVLPHMASAYQVRWLDERYIAMPARDGDGISIVDAESGLETRRVMRGQSYSIVDHAQSVWMGSNRSAVLFVDLEHGRVLHEASSPCVSAPGLVAHVTVDSDGRYRDFVYDPVAEAWFVTTEGRDLVRLAADASRDFVPLIPSPDGSRAALLFPDAGAVTILRTDGGPETRVKGMRVGGCGRILFLDHARLALLPDAGLHPVEIDCDSGEIVRRHDSIRTDSCEFGALSADEALYAQFADGQVTVWELATDRLVFSNSLRGFPGHSGRVAFSPGSTRLFVGAQDRWSALFELGEESVDASAASLDTDPRAVTFMGHTSFVYDVSISPDGRLIASSALFEDCVRVWDAGDGREIVTLGKPAAADAMLLSRGRLLAFSNDGRRLIATERDGNGAPQLFEWDLLMGEARSESAPPGTPNLAHVSWLDRFLELVGPSPRARLGRTAVTDASGAALVVQGSDPRAADGARWSAFSSASVAEALSLSPNGKRAALACLSDLRVVEAPGPTNLEQPLAQIPGQQYCVDWSPDGRLIAAGGLDGRIRLIDGESYQPVISFRAHSDYVYALAWTPDGTRLVSASGDKTVRVWDPRAPHVRRDEQRSYRDRVVALRDIDDATLVQRFGAAHSADERGALVRAALERRAGR